MNITFFIGNGFDINLGLKTRYSDFYPYFNEHAKKDNVIKQWINEDEKPWSDLEEKLGQNLEKLKLNEIGKFYDDKSELDLLLLEYLEQEQNKLILLDDETIRKEFIRSVNNSNVDFSVKDKNSINRTKEIYKNEDFIYEFVCFNYTNTIDRIIDIVTKEDKKIGKHINGGLHRDECVGKVYHIHGTVSEEMILGVNDVSQINNEEMVKNDELLDTFIKFRMNKELGQQKTENVKKIINQSHIIYIFGMSLGNTDKLWWEEIVKWLLSNDNNKLIIFWKGYEDEFIRKIPAKIIRINNKMKKKVFEKGKGSITEEEFDNIKERIIITYNAEIFNFT